MTGNWLQLLAFAALVFLAVLGALEVDRRLASCSDRGFIEVLEGPRS